MFSCNLRTADAPYQKPNNSLNIEYRPIKIKGFMKYLRKSYTQDSTRQQIQNVPGGKVSILGGHSIGHSKQIMYMFMYPIPTVSEIELFHITACITERQDSFRQATRRVLTRIAKCTDVDGGIFENILY
jgi:hypothetical protein